jgi:hypothetical protein
LTKSSQCVRSLVGIQVKTIPPMSTLDSAAIGRRRFPPNNNRDIPLWMGLHTLK